MISVGIEAGDGRGRVVLNDEGLEVLQGTLSEEKVKEVKFALTAKSSIVELEDMDAPDKGETINLAGVTDGETLRYYLSGLTSKDIFTDWESWEES